jgi:SAM-dependent methyltransferase
MRECGLCGGPAALLHPGTAGALTAADLSPTCHRPGAHGDLFRCERCGTVEQAGVPHGDELIALYRAMKDADYLREEKGRRATARRLLGLVERQVPGRGRLLDVGCGHGLLLDEARRRGWRATGLEPSDAARAHAAGVLGLDVRDGTLAGVPATERYEAIVLADVLEHLDDPAAELRRCAALLRPGGALCVVTPDPGSRTARLAGASWWGYLPAHTYLLPRRTLRAVIEEAGLRPAADVGLRRTFTLRTWAGGLAERGGPVGRAVAVAERLPLMDLPVTLSLGDERVVVAIAGVPVKKRTPVVRNPTSAVPGLR